MNASWQPLSWAYVAGFFDGEGCVDCGEKTQHHSGGVRRQFRLKFYQNNREVLDEISLFLAGHGIESKVEVHLRADRLAKAHAGSYALIVSDCKNTLKTLMGMDGHL